MLKEIISNIIKQFGKEIITEERFVNILADYGAFNSNPVYRIVIRDLVNEGFTRKLYNAVNTNSNYDVIKSDLLSKIQKSIPFQAEVLEEVIDSILSCFVTKPLTYINKQLPSNLEYCKQNTPQTKDGLSIEDFFPVNGVHIGCYSWNDAIRDGFKLDKNAQGCYCAENRDGWLWDWDGIGYFYEYQPDTMPKKWEDLGLSRELSYNDTVSFLRKNKFSIKIVKTPSIGKYCGQDVFQAEILATSSDNNFQLEVCFDRCRYSGTLSSSERTMDRVSAKLTNPREYILGHTKQISVEDILSAKNAKDFCHVDRFCLGVTTYHDVKYVYGIKVRFDGACRKFDLPNNCGTLYDKYGDGKFDEIRVFKWDNIPSSWAQLGFCKELSADEWMNLFKRMKFTETKRYEYELIGNANLTLEYISLDKSIEFSLSLKQKGSNKLNYSLPNTFDGLYAKVRF